MSNIYIQEPPTHGKVLLETTAGDIDIELWSREAPKACRNFIQLCMEGYYNGTIFHRVVKGFIAQGGDPTGTGKGGSSIWGKPFKDEFHSRLRFMRRGLVAMANAGRDDNGSQFFFTLGPTPELQSKHTLFGKVAGNTIYNMLKLESGDIDEDEKPAYPYKIIKAKILMNPFDDIVPRESIHQAPKSKKKEKEAGTKNYKLLSFGEEAEEEEEEISEVNKKFSGKSKSSHDLTNDPKLSSQVAVETSRHKKRRHTSGSSSSEERESPEAEAERKARVSSVQEKLKSKTESKKSKQDPPKLEEDDTPYYLGKDQEIAKKKKLEELKKEYKELKTSMKKAEESKKIVEKEEESKPDPAADNNLIQEFLENQKKYKIKTAKAKTKGTDREEMTMALLKKFQQKLEHVKEVQETSGPSKPAEPIEPETKDNDDPTEEDDTWLTKSLDYEGDELIVAKDANLKTADWYALDDPRNPVVQRRRNEAKRAANKGQPGRRDLI
ncbi:unnamed protein product [Allacma fusca]|uniref:Spliceosome-associated protein CWC27 homolog n=1 Tax=Allacma fusca TaxID=39272 RepID=A0A8J2MGE7_9HEXA|nr:unnamed protein product [Allacma fusca]